MRMDHCAKSLTWINRPISPDDKHAILMRTGGTRKAKIATLFEDNSLEVASLSEHQ